MVITLYSAVDQAQIFIVMYGVFDQAFAVV